MTKLIISASAVCILLSACSPTQSPGFSFLRADQSLQGPTPLAGERGQDDNRIDKVDLVKLLDPDAANNDLERAAETFKTNIKTKAKRQQIIERNHVQDRLIAASNQKCGEYVKLIKQYDAETNLLLGIASVVSAGAGAIATPVNTARTLSGLAAIFSGVRAENNDAYFQSLTIQVIAEGIDAQREDILANIHKNRKNADLQAYGLWQAIGDVSHYHQNCSAVAGLQHAAAGIERARDPGLKAMIGFLDNLGEMRSKLNRAAGRSVADTSTLSAGEELPLTAFLLASQHLAVLTTKADMLKELPAAMSLTAPEKATHLKDLEKDSPEYADRLADYDRLVADIAFYDQQMQATNADGKDSTVILDRIAAVQTKANAELDEEKEKTAIIDLQTKAEILRAELASLDAGPTKAKKEAELLLNIRQQEEKADSLRNLRDEIDRLIDTSDRLIQLSKNLPERGAVAKSGAVTPVAPSITVTPAPTVPSE